MNRKRSYIENRRKNVLREILKEPGISPAELSKRFNTSPVTMRRDLQFLEDEKLITRFYGRTEPTREARETTIDIKVMRYRKLISEYAAALVADDDSIFINTSRTALDMIQYIDKRNISVITNNALAIRRDNPVGVNIFLTGGEVRFPKEAMVGDIAEKNLVNIYAKKAFLGCNGFSSKRGLTTRNGREVKINEIMATRATSRTYILADHTKIGNNSVFKACDLNRITDLITDELAPEDELDHFRHHGIEIHQVSIENREWF